MRCNALLYQRDMKGSYWCWLTRNNVTLRPDFPEPMLHEWHSIFLNQYVTHCLSLCGVFLLHQTAMFIFVTTDSCWHCLNVLCLKPQHTQTGCFPINVILSGFSFPPEDKIYKTSTAWRVHILILISLLSTRCRQGLHVINSAVLDVHISRQDKASLYSWHQCKS